MWPCLVDGCLCADAYTLTQLQAAMGRVVSRLLQEQAGRELRCTELQIWGP